MSRTLVEDKHGAEASDVRVAVGHRRAIERRFEWMRTAIELIGGLSAEFCLYATLVDVVGDGLVSAILALLPIPLILSFFIKRAGPRRW